MILQTVQDQRCQKRRARDKADAASPTDQLCWREHAYFSGSTPPLDGRKLTEDGATLLWKAMEKKLLQLQYQQCTYSWTKPLSRLNGKDENFIGNKTLKKVFFIDVLWVYRIRPVLRCLLGIPFMKNYKVSTAWTIAI